MGAVRVAHRRRHADCLATLFNRWVIQASRNSSPGSPLNVEDGYDTDGDGIGNDRPVVSNLKGADGNIRLRRLPGSTVLLRHALLGSEPLVHLFALRSCDAELGPLDCPGHWDPPGKPGGQKHAYQPRLPGMGYEPSAREFKLYENLTMQFRANCSTSSTTAE